MDIEDDLEDIRKLNAIIEAEKAGTQGLELEFVDTESSSEDSDYDDENQIIRDVPTTSEISETETVVVKQDCNISLPVDYDFNDISFLAPFLTYDEFDMIVSCNHPQLKKLLILNRLKKVQLSSLQSNVINLYMRCRRNIQYVLRMKDRLKECSNKSRYTKKLGYPYFKDKNMYPCGPNEDITKKRRNLEMNLQYLPKRKLWNAFGKINLKSKVMLNYFKNLTTHYNTKMDECIQCGHITEAKEYERKVNELKEDYNNDQMRPPPFWEDTFINWNEISEENFKNSKTVQVCRATWNLIVHPEINTTTMSESQLQRFTEVVKQYIAHNWEQIADELDDNRSPLLLCMLYHRKLRNINNKRFTKKDDELLQQAVEFCRKGNRIHWAKVAYCFKQRTKDQLYHHYMYTLKFNSKIKLGAFKEDEDVMLLYLVKQYGENFRKIADIMPHRTHTQLYLRYVNYLKHATLLVGNWTLNEDELIMEHVKTNGAKDWVLLLDRINRTTAHIRHRYNVIKRHMSVNPHLAIQDVPRRHHTLNHYEMLTHRLKIVDYYVNSNIIPSLNCKLGSGKASRGRPTRTIIDHDLMNFFKATIHSQKCSERRNLTDTIIEQKAHSVELILNKLNAKLKIPSESELDTYKLPDLDRKLLSVLRQRQSTHCRRIEIIPPNIETLQTLRFLLKKFENHISNVELDLTNTSSEAFNDLNTLAMRCKALFKWPSLMSLKPPALPEISVTERQEIVVKNEEKRKPGRPKKNLDRMRKMTEVRLKNYQQRAKQKCDDVVDDNETEVKRKKIE